MIRVFEKVVQSEQIWQGEIRQDPMMARISGQQILTLREKLGARGGKSREKVKRMGG